MVENPKKKGSLQGSESTVASPDDGALLFRAKSSDADALSALIDRYTPLVKKIAYSFSGVPESEREDLIQEGLIGLYKAIRLYEPEVSAFSTFAYLCIRRSMLTLLKKLSRTAPTVSLDDLEDAPGAWNGDPLAAVLDRESCEALLQKCDDALSDYENAVLRLHLAGHSVREAAVFLKKSEKSVENALGRARKKLGALL